MASRLKLHDDFISILESGAETDKRVYFQPPESHKMRYPCIRYSLDNIDTRYANDRPYKNINRYQVTVIDLNPDSVIPYEILSRFPMCSFDRSYASNNLNHFVLTLYY